MELSYDEYLNILEDIKSERLLIAQVFDRDQPIIFPSEQDVLDVIRRVQFDETFDFEQHYRFVSREPLGDGVTGSVYEIERLNKNDKVFSLMQHTEDDIVAKIMPITLKDQNTIVNEIVIATRLTFLVHARSIMTFTPLIDWLIVKENDQILALLIYKREAITLTDVVNRGEYGLLMQVLPQVFCTLERMAYVLDFQHNDLHLSNIMLSQTQAAISNFTFERPNGDVLIMRADTLGFVRLIDYGRSYLKGSPFMGDGGRVHRVVMQSLGIGEVDPSFDTRVFALKLLQMIHLSEAGQFKMWEKEYTVFFDNFMRLCDDLLCVRQMREDKTAMPKMLAKGMKVFNVNPKAIMFMKTTFERFRNGGALFVVNTLGRESFRVLLYTYGYIQLGYTPDWDAILGNPMFEYDDEAEGDVLPLAQTRRSEFTLDTKMIGNKITIRML